MAKTDTRRILVRSRNRSISEHSYRRSRSYSSESSYYSRYSRSRSISSSRHGSRYRSRYRSRSVKRRRRRYSRRSRSSSYSRSRSSTPRSRSRSIELKSAKKDAVGESNVVTRAPSCSKVDGASTPPCKWDASDCESEETEFFSPQETLVIRVSNLTDKVTREHLKEVFAIFGTVVDVQMSSDDVGEVELSVEGVDEDKGVERHAFVEYDDSDSVLIAIKHMDGGMMDNQEIMLLPVFDF